MSAPRSVTPVPAATVILVREEGDDLEVFVTRRHRDMAFLGGFYVFPGGKVEPQDLDPAASARVFGLDADLAGRILGLPAGPGLALWIAAVRETFEETGVLLARDAAGARHERPLDGALRTLRGALQRGEIDFAEVLARLGLAADVKALYYFAHWITPETSPRRFDTRFFFAPMPAGQEPEIWRAEVEVGFWIRPAEAIERWEAGEMAMIPPTVATIQTLARHRRSADLLAAFKAEEVPQGNARS